MDFAALSSLALAIRSVFQVQEGHLFVGDLFPAIRNTREGGGALWHWLLVE